MCPGDPTYCIGTPLFPRATIRLENGNRFEIDADAPSSKRRYIASLELNGTPHPDYRLRHADLAAGGALRCAMQDTPNLAQSGSRYQASALVDTIVPLPLIEAPFTMFTDSLEVKLSSQLWGARILYTVESLDSDPLEMSGGDNPCQAPVSVPLSRADGRIAYDARAPIILRKRWNRVSVMAEKDYDEIAFAGTPGIADPAAPVSKGGTTQPRRPSRTLASAVVSRLFFKHTPVGSITLRTKYAPQYTGGGDQALADGLRGQKDFHLGAWQGYEADDIDAVLDLGSVKEINEAGLSCLQDNNAWIFFPTTVSFSFSTDGTAYANERIVANRIPPEKDGTLLNTFGVENLALRARYIRVHAKNLTVCPPWHKGAGGKAWIFADEIVVKVKP